MDFVDCKIGQRHSFAWLANKNARCEHYPIRAVDICQLCRSKGYGFGPVACPYKPNGKGEFLPEPRDNGVNVLHML